MKNIVLTAILFVLVGCQSVTQSVSIFQLSNGPKASQVDFDARQLLIERVSLVDYLRQSSIVFEQANGELIATRYQMWAEPVDNGISRTLVNEINASAQGVRADNQLFATCRNEQACFRVQLYVEKFYPSYDSTVKFAGKYKIYQADKLIEQQDFYLSQALTDDGYNHAVQSLNTLVKQLGNTIVKRVSQQP